MKTLMGLWAILLALLPFKAGGTTFYVNAGSTNPVPPYPSWATAAVNIQDAIDLTVDGDIVLVTNGVYAGGGISMDGVDTNRVSLNRAIRVQSVNGPWVTTIQGWVATNGISGVRCAWLTDNAALIGFTLNSGAAGGTGRAIAFETLWGGGVWCASPSAVVDNCIIVSNTAAQDAAAAYGGTLNNCLIWGNNPNSHSSVVSYAVLNSCTIVSNATSLVAEQSYLTNCIAYYNSRGGYPANLGAIATAYCCAPATVTGPGNFTNAPQFQADGVHLANGSPCIGAGTNLVTGTDIFGMPWANPPSIGCAEFNPVPTVTQPQVNLILQPLGFQIGKVALGGQPPFAFTWLQNGVPLQDNGHFSFTQSSNLIATGVSLADGGNYQLVVSNATGVSTSAVVQLGVHAVDAAGRNPVPPYSTWATAATTIQDAIDAAVANDIVIVTNGFYATGTKSMDGVSTNRVTLDKPLIVASVNGWRNTVIEGAWDPVNTNGPAAVRCAWLTNGAELNGFMLQNGAANEGGGVQCEWYDALVSNCVLSNNSAVYGGGICYGTLDNSLVITNFATEGGGCYFSMANNCLIVSNVANSGGGTFNATLNNCTVEMNLARTVGGAGGTSSDPVLLGAGNGYVRNSIVVNNWDTWSIGPNSFALLYIDNYGSGSPPYQYCCTASSIWEAPSGPGNILADPAFVDFYHLSIYSPCRGAGNQLYASGADYDGNLWNDPPSMGCSEVVISNLVGPLSVAMTSYIVAYPYRTNVLVSLPPSSVNLVSFTSTVTGRAASLSWNFGDGPAITNADYQTWHYWTNTGVYNVVFTAYNDDNPEGISTNLIIYVVATNSTTTTQITWTPIPISYGTALSANQLNAAANVAGSFAYNPTNGAVLNAGTNTLSVIFTPTDTVDYSSLTDTVSLVVSPAVLTVIADNASRPDGQANPAFAGTIAGVTNGDDISATYTCGATSGSPPGTYPIVPSLVDPDNRQTNYTVTLVNGTLAVGQVPLVMWTNPVSITYGSALSTNQLNATANVPGSFAYNPTYGTVLNTGTNTLSVVFTPTDTVDYGSVTNTVSLVVSPALLTVTAANASRTYGMANPVFAGTVNRVANGDNLTATYTCGATFSSPPGTYPIVPSLVDPDNRQTNYTVTLINGTLTVGQTNPLVMWTNPAAITYGAPLSPNQLNATANVPGNFEYNPINGTVLNAGTNTLSVIFTPTDTVDYYSVTDTVSLVVSPAVLTVIAANASWTYGQANPVFLGTLTGVTNGDNITATYICGATPSSPPGTYPILPSLVDPDNRQTNYNVVFVNGTLTVWQAIPLATWTNPASITYGVALSTNQLNATASVPGSFAYNPTNGTVLNTGTYTLSVVFTPTDTVDYSTVFETVSVEVSPAVLTVTAANASRAYGQANPAFAGSVIGVTNGDNLTAVFACNATPTSSPGSYPIVPSLVDPENRQTNYTVTLVNGVLTVTQPFPPFLSYVFAPPNLTLSWPTNASAFTLIGTPSLDGPIVWTPLTNGITVNGTNETITINPGSGNQYYKLTAP